jgi:hypothetical protein
MLSSAKEGGAGSIFGTVGGPFEARGKPAEARLVDAVGTEQENSASFERLKSARRMGACSSSSSWPRLSQPVSFPV